MDVRTERPRASRGRYRIIASAVLASLGWFSAPARAVDSYISVQGVFNANLGQRFDLQVDSPISAVMQTWGNPGGTNAAGEVIASGGIDSVLVLQDSLGNPI